MPGPRSRSSRLGLGAGTEGRGAAERAAEGISTLPGLIESAGASCVAVKPQLACFERLGAPGWAALAQTVVGGAGRRPAGDRRRQARRRAAHAPPSTRRSFRVAPTRWATPGLGADAATVNPLLGGDALDAFIECGTRRRRRGSSCSCGPRTRAPRTCSTSTPAAPRCSSGIAALVADACGGSPASAASRAWAPWRAPPSRAISPGCRELMPRSIFLVPGVGAQGGQASDLGPALGAHPASILVAASRSIAGRRGSRGRRRSALRAWGLAAERRLGERLPVGSGPRPTAAAGYHRRRRSHP